MKFLKRLMRSLKSSQYIYISACSAIFLMLTAFCHITSIDESPTKINFARNLGDTILLTFGFWLITPKWRWIIVFPTIFVSIFFLINIWYFRFWHDLLPVSCLTMTENINGLLLNSIWGLLSWSDAIFIICPFLVFAAISRHKKARPTDKSKTNIKACALLLLCFIMAQAAISESGRRWQQNELNVQQSLQSYTKERVLAQPYRADHYFKNNGLIIHIGRMLTMPHELKHLSIRLSDEDKQSVARYITHSNQDFHSKDFAANKDKNIILIIAESLNAEVINRRVNNREITPTLNSLIKTDGTLYATSLESQIRESSSGDGQMIYNSGILPLEVGATPLHLTYKVKLHPLASQLNRNIVAAVFAGEATAWKEQQNFQNYGFARISSNRESTNELLSIGSDAAMFNRGNSLLANAQEPFFLEFITESMHIPFNDKGVHGHNWIFDDKSLSHEEANYYRMCTYFDHHLNSFIDFLKEKGLYDNTILIIASDHSQNLATASANRIDNDKMPIVFIATNTGTTKHISKPVGQIDVFPTILQIAGVENPEFAGVGTSMLDSVRTTDMKAAQKISELILRGNYFGTITD